MTGSRLILSVSLLFIILFAPAGAHAAYRALSGNLSSYLNNLCIPPSGTEVFDEPSPSDMLDWKDAIDALIAEDYQLAADLAELQLYDLVQFTDAGSGCVYYVFIEKLCPATLGCFAGLFFDPEPCRGLGTFVFNPHSRRALNIQVPHAITDEGTRPEGISMFLQLQATFLQITGTTRCANAASGCGGPTGACGGSGPYRVSDVAHYTENFYQVTSTRVHELLPEVVAVSVHGFEACSSSLGTNVAQINNGTGSGACDASNEPNSLATQLAAEYRVQISNMQFPYPGRGAASCNLAPGEPAELELAGCPIFCGGSNVQGRAINGSTGTCPRGTCDHPDPEAFIHLEQLPPLRIAPPGLPFPYPYPGMSWQITIDVFAATFDILETWVEFGYGGAEVGHYCQPYDTVGEALRDSGLGATVFVKAGSSPEVVTINQRVTVRSYGGPAVIGR